MSAYKKPELVKMSNGELSAMTPIQGNGGCTQCQLTNYH